MYEYQTILDCMVFTSNGTISLDVHVGSEENLNVNELSIFASRQCITKCNMCDLEFYGFKIMRIHRLKLDKINLIYKPFE